MLDSTSKVLEDSARGGFYLTIGSMMSTIIQGLSVIIIARILGSEQYGLYTISTVIPSLLILLVDPGINQGIIKFSASLRVKGDERRLGRLLLQSISIEAILGLTTSVACFILSDQLATWILNRPEIGGLIKIASAIIFLQTLFTTINSIFIGYDKTEYNTITTIAQALAKATLTVILLLLGLSIAGALIGIVTSYVLACLMGIALLVYKIYKPLKKSVIDSVSFLDNLKLLVKYGLPLYASVIIGGIALQYRVIIMTMFTSDAEIGNFQAAMNFNTILTSIYVSFAAILLPTFSKLEQKKDVMKRFYKIAVKYTSLIMLPIAILLTIYAQEAVQIIYGTGFGLTAYYLSLYMSSYLLVVLGFNTLVSFFAGIGETKINLKITMMSSITLMISAPPLAYFFRVTGIIITLILSSLAGTAYGLYRAKKSYDINIDLKMLTRIYIVTLVPTLPVLAIKSLTAYSSLLTITLGAVTYFAIYLIMIPITGAITRIELKEIKRILERIKLLNYIAKPVLYCEERIFETFFKSN